MEWCLFPPEMSKNNIKLVLRCLFPRVYAFPPHPRFSQVCFLRLIDLVLRRTRVPSLPSVTAAALWV